MRGLASGTMLQIGRVQPSTAVSQWRHDPSQPDGAWPEELKLVSETLLELRAIPGYLAVENANGFTNSALYGLSAKCR